MPTYMLKQYDTSPPLRAKLQHAAGKPIPLGVQDIVYLNLRPKVGLVGPSLHETCVVTSADRGMVEYRWRPGDTDVPGMYDAEFEVHFADGTTERIPNDEYIDVIVEATLGPPPVYALTPPVLSVAAVTATSVTLTWTRIAGARTYEVYFADGGALLGTTSATTFVFDGAAPITAYAFMVRARDPQGNASGWSNTMTAFTSLA